MKIRLLLLVFLLTVLLSACAVADSLTFPANLKIIMEEAYAGDTGFDRLILPSGIREIGRNAFRGCSLDSVYLPSNLEALGENAFDSRVEILVSPGSRTAELLQAQGRAYTELILPERITLSVDGVIPLGGRKDLNVTVEPAGADTDHLMWSVSDDAVAALSGDGAVVGLSGGTAVVRAEAINGAAAEIEVTVHKPVCRALLIANVNYTYMYSSDRARWNAGDIDLLKTMFGTVYAPNGEPWQITVAYDQWNTKMEATIRNTFANTQEGDISLIHISSHGYNKFSEGNYQAVGLRMSNSNHTMTYIPYSTLKGWTDRYIRGDVILILETCYAAGAIAPRCGAPFCDDGYYVLASCGYEEHCYSNRGNYNYFVEWLVEGVRGMAADTNGDRAISLGELNRFIYSKGCAISVVEEYTYYQHSEAYPVNSNYILFLAR